MNTDFKELSKQLEELRKDNNALSKPLQIPEDSNLEESIKKDQENASDELGDKEESPSPQDQQNKLSKAQKNQKKAAQKMEAYESANGTANK